VEFKLLIEIQEIRITIKMEELFSHQAKMLQWLKIRISVLAQIQQKILPLDQRKTPRKVLTRAKSKLGLFLLST
jgi:hypothetical protein